MGWWTLQYSERWMDVDEKAPKDICRVLEPFFNRLDAVPL